MSAAARLASPCTLQMEITMPLRRLLLLSFGQDLLKFATVLPAIVWLLARSRVSGPTPAAA